MAAPRIGFVSLGCPKAPVDSERILTALRGDGDEIVPSCAGANLVVVNACGFIEDALGQLTPFRVVEAVEHDLRAVPAA